MHMDALVSDSVAFGVASVTIMCAQIACAAAGVTLANWAANRMVSTPAAHLTSGQPISCFNSQS